MKKNGFILNWFIPLIMVIFITSGVNFLLDKLHISKPDANGLYAQDYVEPKNPVPGFLRNITIQSPTSYKNLTIYPVVTKKYGSFSGLITMDEAINLGKLFIREVNEGGEVNKLIANNKSNDYVFIMAGEILTGGKQDRILKFDILLPPKSGDVELYAFCVEKGRWTSKSENFMAGKGANISVRQNAQIIQDQGSVWASVDKTHSGVGADAPSTGTLNMAYESKEYKEISGDYLDAFSDIPKKYPNANGVVVIINGKILVSDIFMRPKLLGELWPKLVQSYIPEAMADRQEVEFSKGSEDIISFIEKLNSAQTEFIKTQGSGMLINFKGRSIDAQALVFDLKTLHIAIFPASIEPTKKIDDITPVIRNY